MLFSANYGLLLKDPCGAIASHSLGCIGLEVGGEIFRRSLGRPSSDKGAGAAISAGVVAAMRGVGLPQANSVDGGGERGGGDLAVHRRGAVAELGGADRQVKSALIAQLNPVGGKKPHRLPGYTPPHPHPSPLLPTLPHPNPASHH